MFSSAYEIAGFIVGLSVSALLISAIPAVLQMKKTLKAVEELSLEAKKTAETFNATLQRIDAQIAALEETIKRFKETGERVNEVIELFVEEIKKPIIAIGSVLSAITCAFRLFFGKEHAKGGVKNDD